MDYKLYLERIGVVGKLEANLATLNHLQYQHLLHVPFENLDIWYQRPITLDFSSFYDKIVLHHRGGYCYECNGLFHTLLQWIGFDSRMVSCRVMNGKHIGEPFDHMALIVTLDGTEWLVDVGFGDFSVAPLQLNIEMPQHDRRNQYIVEPFGEIDGGFYNCASRMKATKGKFLPIYLIDRKARQLTEFNGMNAWHQSSPESHFTKQLICSRLAETGRISLISNRLITTDGANKEERLLYHTARHELLINEMGMPETELAKLIEHSLVGKSR